MKTWNFELGTLNSRCAVAALTLIAYASFCNDGQAQVQQAWVTHYNNRIANGKHQALRMALDFSGNIYITGFSQNSFSNIGYATLKYTPSSSQLWVARYDSTNYPMGSPTAIALDSQGQPAITGTAVTLKYDADGNQLWAAPYAGLAIAADSNRNTFVTGFGTDFDTVKLSPTGSNLWLATYKDVGPTVGQAIGVDNTGNACVSGSDIYMYYSNGAYTGHYAQLLTVGFASNGVLLWTNGYPTFGTLVQVPAIALDKANNFYVAANFNTSPDYAIFKFLNGGGIAWSSSLGGSGSASALSIDHASEVLLTGQMPRDYPNFAYGTGKLDANGSRVWLSYFPGNVAHYPESPVQDSLATGIATDIANNVFVTGYSPDANGTNDIVTIAYDTNGKQLWLERYSGAANAGAVGNAIAVDKGGNVYVAGYENVAGGGTEMVLIKYAPVTLQHQTNGNFLLQAQGAAGEPFDIRATTNLQTWLDLGTNNADTNGILQYLDTNAPLYPWRFYLAIPQ